MLLAPITLGLVVLATPQVTTHQVTLDGAPRGLYAADVDADGQLEGLVVLATRAGRRIAVLDGAELVSGQRVAPRSVAIPDDAAYAAVCPGLGAGLLLARPDGLERLAPDGSVQLVSAVPGALPFAEQGDLVLIEICPAPGGAAPALLPTLGGAVVVSPGAPPRELRVPTRVHMASGLTFRGPRARRDLSLLTLLVHPRFFVGDLDGDGKPDLAAAVEEQLGIYPSAGESQTLVLGLRGIKQRREREGLVDTRLVELTGDGVLDAVVTFQRGGSDTMKTSWRVFAGPLIGKRRGRILATVERPGLAAPLLFADVDLDGQVEVVEPLVDTGILAMGKALITGDVPVAYRVHRFAGGQHRTSEPLDIDQEVDFGRGTNLAGHPPLLGADLDGDGRGDLVALGSATQLALHPGRDGALPFAEDPSVEVDVPATERAVLLRQGRQGPPVVLLLDEKDGAARITAVVFSAEKRAARRRGR